MIAVCSLYTPEIRELGEFTFANKQFYCDRHGYQFIGEVQSLEPSRPASWSKIILLQRHLKNFEWMMWSDADSIFTTPEKTLEAILIDDADLVIAKDNCGINAGQFFIRNTPAAYSFLARIWSMTEMINHHWWEQAAMMKLLAGNDHGLSVRYADKRHFNSYPEDWQSGDLVLHTPGRGNRLQILRATTTLLAV